MITLPEHLEQLFKRLAEQKHETVDALLVSVVEEYLEDYYDIQLAEQALKRVESGQDTLLDWQDVKAELYDMED